jgi:hypothetical protein
MSATYTPGASTDLNRVRLLIPDTNVSDDNALLQDAEINDLLAMFTTVFAATAEALEIIANSETLVLKKLRLLGDDIQTDGPAVAESLRVRAAQLRTRDSASSGSFEIITMGLGGQEDTLMLDAALRELC